jgi:hypothetical protein
MAGREIGDGRGVFGDFSLENACSKMNKFYFLCYPQIEGVSTQFISGKIIIHPAGLIYSRPGLKAILMSYWL